MSGFLDQLRCTVLNATYEPLSIVSARRGLVLVMKGKAMIVEAHATHIVQLLHGEHPVPTSVVLKHWVKSRPTYNIPAVLSQRNLFLRDEYRCGYCMRHRSDLKTHEFLTRDHVLPRVKSGRDVWTNVITACSTCNNKKADYVLADIGMTIKKPLTAPTIFELQARQTNRRKH